MRILGCVGVGQSHNVHFVAESRGGGHRGCAVTFPVKPMATLKSAIAAM